MTNGKTIALTRWTFVGKVISLLFNMLSRFVMAFLPRSKHLLILWLQSPSEVILEPKQIKSVTVSIVCLEVLVRDSKSPENLSAFKTSGILQYHSSKASSLLCSAFFIVQLSHLYMTTGKTIALT